MRTKTTIVANKRKDILSNKEEIKDTLGISEETYFWTKVETGTAFLDLHFPKNGEFEKYYKIFRNDPMFWAWWNLKWTNHEASIISYFREFPESYDLREWRMEMDSIQDDEKVTNSFHHNYIKKVTANV